MKRELLQTCVCLSVCALLPAGSHLRGQEKAPEAAASMASGTREGLIGADDALNIYVPASTEISKVWRVGATGELVLPLVGKMEAAGKTVNEFEQALNKELAVYIRNPQAIVSLLDVRSQPVTVIGAVPHPGKFQLVGKRTLLDILMQAGGPSQAGPTITVTRNVRQGRIPLPEARDAENGRYSVAELSLDEILAARTPAANLVVAPLDVVTVSGKPTPRLVQIMGEVNKPGAIELIQQESVSIIQTLAAAGGVTNTASLGKTVIMHINKEGVRTEVARVDLRKVLEGKVKDLELIPGDVVIVPTSRVKSYLDTATRSLAASSTLVLARF